MEVSGVRTLSGLSGEYTPSSRWQHMDLCRLTEWRDHCIDHAALRRRLTQRAVSDEATVEEWRSAIFQDLEKVNAHYLDAVQGLERQVHDVRERGEVAVTQQSLSNRPHLEIDLSKVMIKAGLDKFEGSAAPHN